MNTTSVTKSNLNNPKELLRHALQERCANNSMYSLRSFARATGISHTVLSLVLSGKRNLSKKATIKLADYLELNPEQKEKLMKVHRSPKAEDFKTISLDTFEVISDWYHYAILSLLDLPEAKFDARWIAKQLGLQILTAKMAMERLQRLNLVAQDENGRWKQTGQPIKIDNMVSTSATRKFHKQLLNRAAESIENDPISKRDFTSMTFAMNENQIEYARKRIQDFRRQLVAELELKGEPTNVYNIQIQLYPVTPTLTKES